jgi:hypothetical protein
LTLPISFICSWDVIEEDRKFWSWTKDLPRRFYERLTEVTIIFGDSQKGSVSDIQFEATSRG